METLPTEALAEIADMTGMKWEYIIDVHVGNIDQGRLDTLGASQWEMVNFVHHSGANNSVQLVFVFRRPVAA